MSLADSSRPAHAPQEPRVHSPTRKVSGQRLGYIMVLTPGGKREVCQWFLKGNCKFGHKCKTNRPETHPISRPFSDPRRARPRPSRRAHVDGPEEQEGRPSGSEREGGQRAREGELVVPRRQLFGSSRRQLSAATRRPFLVGISRVSCAHPIRPFLLDPVSAAPQDCLVAA